MGCLTEIKIKIKKNVIKKKKAKIIKANIRIKKITSLSRLDSSITFR